VEVLLVLVILGVIAAMVVPNVLGRQEKAMIDVTKASIRGLEGTLKLYAVDHDGSYPQGNQDAINQLLQPTDKDGNSMPAYTELVYDAWDEMFYYRYPGTKQEVAGKPDIWSSGPNRQNEDGAGDDVNNWDK
jgi:general secretion pathway protein G